MHDPLSMCQEEGGEFVRSNSALSAPNNVDDSNLRLRSLGVDLRGEHPRKSESPLLSASFESAGSPRHGLVALPSHATARL